MDFFQHLASGINNKESFIVRGTDCKDKEYPAIGALHYGNQFICTGSVIDERFFLTASHCVVGSGGVPAPASNFKVVLGNVSRSSNAHVYTFSKVISHEEYNDGTIANDIALMKFSKPVDFSSDYIKPLCIPSKNRKFEGQEAMAVGWGRDENGNIPEVLKKVEVDVCSKRYCSFVYYLLSQGRLEISDKQICSGSRMKGVCNNRQRYGRSNMAICGDNGAATKQNKMRPYILLVVVQGLTTGGAPVVIVFFKSDNRYEGVT
ncbi:achelase-2-like [Centruroides sculpturatus]|uniref:achelase-2-like n=1 Tax=Centruroides sculpturatus TaxID=218467 RepID=UPI000C6DA591|nr:achelase-2-like [Centruroides sculpturatus]